MLNNQTLQLQDHQEIIESRIKSAIQLAIKLDQEIILSHSFRIDASDLLPILTHPADRHSTRIYLEKPSSETTFKNHLEKTILKKPP